MSAPSSSILVAEFKKNSTIKLGPEGEEYMKTLMGAVSDGWSQWQNAASFKGLTVTGNGVGAWAGSGTGGSLGGIPFALPQFVFKKDSDEQKMLTQALREVLQKVFGDFLSSYKFSTVTFVGTSTATPTSPGVFNATAQAAPLSSAGSGTNPSGIADAWAPKLTKPKFDIDNPQAQTRNMIEGVSKAIEGVFKNTWLLQTNASLNSATGVSAPGSGTGTATSGADGKLV